jgi:hypothetical protein
MSARFQKLAESMATHSSTSRRGFMAWAGQGAMGLAAGLAGLIALSSNSHADANATTYCCCYSNGAPTLIKTACSQCPATQVVAGGITGRLMACVPKVNGRCRCPV